MSAPVPAKSICQAVLSVYLQICQGERYRMQVAFSQTSPEMASSSRVYLYAGDARRREQLSCDVQLRSFYNATSVPILFSIVQLKDESPLVLPTSVMLNRARMHTF